MLLHVHCVRRAEVGQPFVSLVVQTITNVKHKIYSSSTKQLMSTVIETAQCWLKKTIPLFDNHGLRAQHNVCVDVLGWNHRRVTRTTCKWEVLGEGMTATVVFRVWQA